jgi:uncharacterized protein (TIGR03435 family)
MPRFHNVIAVIVVSTSGLWAQGPSFEVASVKPNKGGSSSAATSAPPVGTIHIQNTPVRLLIINAYGLKPFQLVGGPNWVGSERFDIVARPPDKTPPTQLPVMIRTLLADRFKLKAHMEIREQPIYELVLARDDQRLGPGLTKSDTDCAAVDASRAAGQPQPAPPSSATGRPACRMRMSISDAAGSLDIGGRPLTAVLNTFGNVVNRHVVDRTGLAGPFDVELRWSETTLNPAAPTTEAPSFFAALQEQLGLRLRTARGPVEVLVIDSIERPTPD